MGSREPITAELRELLADVNWVEITDHMCLDHGGILDGDWLDSWHAAVDHACDAIDAVHAQLERDYKAACEANRRQYEQYADVVHKLNRANAKNLNQRKQLTEVQEAIHRRNEGELKARWQKELDRLERENAELRERLAVLDNRSESMHIGSATVTITPTLDWTGVARELRSIADTLGAQDMQAENAKLRELVLRADRLMQGVLDNATDTVVVSDLPCCDTLYDNLTIYREDMCELGVEVDG